MRLILITAVASFVALGSANAQSLTKSECKYLDTHLQQMIEGIQQMTDAADELDTGPVQKRTKGALLASIKNMDEKRQLMIPSLREFLQASEEMSRQLRRC